MRRFTLTLIAVLAAAVSFAQPKGVTDLKMAPKSAVAQQIPVKGFEKAAFEQATAQLRMKGEALKQVQNAPAKSPEDLITDPEGTVQGYARQGGCFFYNLGLGMGEQGGYMKTVISEDGKTMYFRDLVSRGDYQTYVVGNVSEDGKTVTVPLGQKVTYLSSYDCHLVIQQCYFELTEDLTGIVSYGWYEDVDEVVFDVAEDGTMSCATSTVTMTDDGNLLFTGLGLVYDDDWTFAITMDYNSVYVPGDMPEPAVVPEGVELSDYSFVSKDYYGNESAKLIQAGWDGDDLWITNFEAQFPTAAIKGTRQGDKVVFETPQYLGNYAGVYDINLMGAVSDPEAYYVLTENLVFDYDEATGTLSLDEDHAMVSNAALDRVYYLTFYLNAKIAPYVETPGVPNTPAVTAYSCRMSLGGYDYASFSIPMTTVDGNMMNPDKVSYVIYVDGEPFTLAPEPEFGAYPNLEEEMTEIPYGFADGWDISAGGKYVYFYETAFSTIGVQTIYRGGGEEHKSEVIHYYTGVADANDTERTGLYTSFDGDEEMVGTLGTQRIESYDVAALIQDTNLTGAKIKGMTILTAANSYEKGNFKGWAANKLGLEKVDGVTKAAADYVGNTTIEVVDEDADFSKITVAFDEPVEVTEDGVFVGYSFDVFDNYEECDAYPVALAVEPSANGFFLHTSKSYHSWVNQGASYNNAILPVVLEFVDGTVAEVGARVYGAGESYVKVGETSTVNLTLANNGTTDVNEVEVTVAIDGKEVATTVTLDEPLAGAYWGQKTNVTVEIPAIETVGAYPYTVDVTAVNGQANLATAKGDAGLVNAVAFVPKHKALVEEYTGTWCGYCPRGMTGMSILARDYEEESVGVAYHNGDPMESLWTNSFGYPNYVSGFPTAYINRAASVDPYYGSNNFIGEDVVAAAAEFAAADVEIVEAKFDNSEEWNGVVNVKVNTKFAVAAEDGRYNLEFIAIENGMCGEEDGWSQSNYYDGYTPEQLGEDMAWLSGAGSYISGLEFDEVFLVSSLYVGDEQFLPETVEANGEYEAEYTLYVKDMIDTNYEIMVQDVTKMEVVVAVVDTTTGAIANVTKAPVEVVPNGITNVIEDSQKKSSAVYNLAGQKVSKNYRGVVINNGKKFIRK